MPIFPTGQRPTANGFEVVVTNEPIPVGPSLYENFFGKGELSGVTVPAKPEPPTTIFQEIGLPAIPDIIPIRINPLYVVAAAVATVIIFAFVARRKRRT